MKSNLQPSRNESTLANRLAISGCIKHEIGNRQRWHTGITLGVWSLHAALQEIYSLATSIQRSDKLKKTNMTGPQGTLNLPKLIGKVG